jgi:hypothetical protein
MKRLLNVFVIAGMLTGAGSFPLWGRSANVVQTPQAEARAFDPFSTAAAARHRTGQSTSWRSMVLNQ